MSRGPCKLCGDAKCPVLLITRIQPERQQEANNKMMEEIKKRGLPLQKNKKDLGRGGGADQGNRSRMELQVRKTRGQFRSG